MQAHRGEHEAGATGEALSLVSPRPPDGAEAPEGRVLLPVGRPRQGSRGMDQDAEGEPREDAHELSQSDRTPAEGRRRALGDRVQRCGSEGGGGSGQRKRRGLAAERGEGGRVEARPLGGDVSGSIFLVHLLCSGSGDINNEYRSFLLMLVGHFLTRLSVSFEEIALSILICR